jgi:hypothetical protein
MKKQPFPYKVSKFRGIQAGSDITGLYQSKADIAPGTGPSYERNVYWALLQVGYDASQIAYQVPIDGGRMSRNGLIVDFVLYTPSAIPIQVGATWWHRDSAEDTLEDARISNIFGRPPIRFYDDDADTRQHALAAVRRYL